MEYEQQRNEVEKETLCSKAVWVVEGSSRLF